MRAVESVLDLVKTIQKSNYDNYLSMKAQRLFLLEGDKNNSKIAGGVISHMKFQAGIGMFQKFKYSKSSGTMTQYLRLRMNSENEAKVFNYLS